jgi:hypothetical protein
MRHLKIAFAVAAAVAGSSLMVGNANATTLGATGLSAAFDSVAAVQQVDYRFGGRRHCWYPIGWHGPGWYWCGYANRRGHGWGGGDGYRGWRH